MPYDFQVAIDAADPHTLATPASRPTGRPCRPACRNRADSVQLTWGGGENAPAPSHPTGDTRASSANRFSQCRFSPASLYIAVSDMVYPCGAPS